MGPQCCGSPGESSCPREGRGIQPAGRNGGKHQGKEFGVSRIHSGPHRMSTGETQSKERKMDWQEICVQPGGHILGNLAATGPGTQSTPGKAGAEPGLVAFSWNLPPPALPCPITTSFQQGLGRPADLLTPLPTMHPAACLPLGSLLICFGLPHILPSPLVLSSQAPWGDLTISPVRWGYMQEKTVLTFANSALSSLHQPRS